jgi:hypothetical protein
MELGEDGGQQKKDGEEQASKSRMDKGENITGGMGVVLGRMKGMRVIVDKEGGSLKVAGEKGGEGGNEVSVEDWLGDFPGEDIEVIEVVSSGVTESEGDRSVETVLSLGGEDDRFGFLECIENEGVDEEAEKRRGEEKERGGYWGFLFHSGATTPHAHGAYTLGVYYTHSHTILDTQRRCPKEALNPHEFLVLVFFFVL